MDIFDLLTLLGGLAMFLFGMRLMGDGLKESASGPLKNALEKLTNTSIKGFFLGFLMTAVIQSSTATIVITSGLVGAGILTLHQSLGIIIGANVGTTITGQIIRLLDVDSSGTAFLRLFQPAALAPLALIVGMVIIMSGKPKGKAGQIFIGFGVLFSGLMNMTAAVEALKESGIIESMFARLGSNPLLAYLVGLAVAFVLQSSSASVGILQAFSSSGALTFGTIYPVLVGIYLGDCVTTAIVCNIGAKPDAKRVGMVNILFNLCKTAVIFIAVGGAHALGLLDGLWGRVLDSGGIANANTLFNLACAVVLFPCVGLFERLSHKLIKDEPVAPGKYDELLGALSPVFLSTPAIAFGRCHDVLITMCDIAQGSIGRAFDTLVEYDQKLADRVVEDEEYIDVMTERMSNYLIQISAHITSQFHLEIMNHYYSVVTEFERLSDHAMNIVEVAQNLHNHQRQFSAYALSELAVLRELIEKILEYVDAAVKKRDVVAAQHIEPLEEVMDDIVMTLKDNHVDRLRKGVCSTLAGTEFLNLLTEAERICDVCSNIGLATIARVMPEFEHQMHDYSTILHSGQDPEFNQEYRAAHDYYFDRLK